jgi:hypothetical protein
MAKATYDNTVHFDEHHYSPTIAAAFADRESNEATERRLRLEHRRLVERIDGTTDGSERAKLVAAMQEADREIRDTVARRKDIEERIREVTA